MWWKVEEAEEEVEVLDRRLALDLVQVAQAFEVVVVVVVVEDFSVGQALQALVAVNITRYSAVPASAVTALAAIMGLISEQYPVLL